jgi:hypothetical protein
VQELPPLGFGAAAVELSRCALRTTALLARGQLHQPRSDVGRRLRFADGTTGTVYRETVVDRAPPRAPTVLVVGFRLRGVRSAWGHALFRLESVLNTVLFAGFPGLLSKLWLAHDEHGVYRGVYEWDGPELAHAYVRALWWPLALVSERGSIHYAVLPGIRRRELFDDPHVVDPEDPEDPEAWWRLRDAGTADAA